MIYVKCTLSKVEGKEVEVVWACDEKKGALGRKEGDGNEGTGKKEERKTQEKMDGQSKE